MSQKQIKHESPGTRSSKGGGGKKNDKNLNNRNDVDSKFKESVVKKLYDSFQDSFTRETIAAVAHTCQWDLCRATEALMILGDTSNVKNGKNSKNQHADLTKNKTKSLPSTLKSHRGERSDSIYSAPNGLRSNPAHMSTNSLSSGQVWQRHYKSKPQSPGLLTMIPPSHGRDSAKLKKAGSARSLPTSTSSLKRKESPEVKKASAAILKIQQLVQDGVKVMVLMRGVPGSGKTHLAQIVVNLVTSNELSQHVFSTDDYFILLGRGHYAYDSNQLEQAHNWNQKRVSEALRRSTNPVVVDNTHTQAWEMQPYVAMAVQHGYVIEVLEPVTPWRKNEGELAKRNVHSVPREKIRQMLDKYEPGWTGDKLLQLFGLKYTDCGAAHISRDLTSYKNSPLAQHRQHAIVETPEKPKRKKNNTKKKDRKLLAGVEITEDAEKQLEELNQLFAEYGKQLDPLSKKIVLESGVPISEVISRLRKKQGTDLPLPKTNIQPEVSRTVLFDNNVVKPVANYIRIPRESPSESLEPMSSSNASETSECETDTDAELANLKHCRLNSRFFGDDFLRAKSEGAIGGNKPSKTTSLMTSSQEELSLIDFEVNTPERSSQEELSIIDYEDDKDSSSSEEQETQLLTLQESLREVLIDNYEKTRTEVEEAAPPPPRNEPQVELSDSLLDVINKRFQNEPKEDLFLDKENNVIERQKKSPDLEEIPLPSIPPKTGDPLKNFTTWPMHHDKLENIIGSWEHPVDDSSPKPARPESAFLMGAIKKTEPEKSPEELLKSNELSWSSIPFTSSWENLHKKMPEKEFPGLPKPQRKTIEKSDCSTNTVSSDFELWKSDSKDTVKLTPRSRNINENLRHVEKIPNVPEILMLDKSSMTEDEEFYAGNVNAIDSLSGMFPDVPKDHLSDILEKCKGDVVWAIELLLESSTDAASFVPFEEPAKETESRIVSSTFESVISDGKKTIKRRKDRKNAASELSLLLKKQIEESIHINEDLYQDKTLFLKKLKRGEIKFGDDVIPELLVPEPPRIFDNGVLETVSAESFQEDEEDEDEETIQMKIDEEFFDKLAQRFGVPEKAANNQSLSAILPVIDVPISLAEQIYNCWLESINRQVEEMQNVYENMVKEDELLAAALQEQEHDARKPDLREIMDMELAMTVYEQDRDPWQENTQDTIASKLSQQLLFEAYPNIDKKTLLSLFHSQGNSFQRTVELLNNSLMDEAPKTVMTPEFISAYEKKLLDQALENSKKTEDAQKPIIIVKQPSSRKKNKSDAKDTLIVNPAEFRQKITLLQQRRNECCRRAQEAIRKRSYSVASYFSHLASLYKERIQKMNSGAISVKLFEEKPDEVTTKLDLHFLFVHEALQVLDLFLDYQITNLRDKRINTLDIYLITGRGLRSYKGKSRIKPAVQKRLDQRQLSYVEDNPGMLKVVLHKNDLLSDQI